MGTRVVSVGLRQSLAQSESGPMPLSGDVRRESGHAEEHIDSSDALCEWGGVGEVPHHDVARLNILTSWACFLQAPVVTQAGAVGSDLSSRAGRSQEAAIWRVLAACGCLMFVSCCVLLRFCWFEASLHA